MQSFLCVVNDSSGKSGQMISYPPLVLGLRYVYSKKYIRYCSRLAFKKHRFPEWDYPELKVDDGIDLLTSLGDLDSNECRVRAKTQFLGHTNRESLCAEDLYGSKQKTK